MSIEKTIKEKLKQKKVVIGYKSVIKSLKTSRPELVVYANNFPDEEKKMVEHNAKISNVEIKEYPNDSVNLGLVCGKPFAVSVLAIKRNNK
jgi:large subunit ribosomal protein L30e